MRWDRGLLRVEAQRALDGSELADDLLHGRWVIVRRGKEMNFRIKRERFEVKAVEGRMLEDGYGYAKIRGNDADADAGE